MENGFGHILPPWLPSYPFSPLFTNDMHVSGVFFNLIFASWLYGSVQHTLFFIFKRYPYL